MPETEYEYRRSGRKVDAYKVNSNNMAMIAKSVGGSVTTNPEGVPRVTVKTGPNQQERHASAGEWVTQETIASPVTGPRRVRSVFTDEQFAELVQRIEVAPTEDVIEDLTDSPEDEIEDGAVAEVIEVIEATVKPEQKKRVVKVPVTEPVVEVDDEGGEE
jgi:hypothetical protein